jgi:hypothetical protein
MGDGRVVYAKPLDRLVEAALPAARRGASMSNVLVFDTNRQPLDLVHPGRTCLPLDCGKAAVFKRSHCTIRLKAAVEHAEVHLPGSRSIRAVRPPGSPCSMSARARWCGRRS